MDLFALIRRLLTLPLNKERLQSELGVVFHRENVFKRWRAECTGILTYAELIDISDGDNRLILGINQQPGITQQDVEEHYDWIDAEISQIIPEANIISYVFHMRGQDLIFSFVRNGSLEILRMVVIVRPPAAPVNLGKEPM